MPDQSPNLIAIEWKDEDEVGGVAIGPVWQVLSDGSREKLEKDGDDRWMSLPEAIRYAEERGVAWTEV